MLTDRPRDYDAEFDLPEGFLLEDILCSPEALDACLSDWNDVGEDEPDTLNGWSV